MRGNEPLVQVIPNPLFDPADADATTPPSTTTTPPAVSLNHSSQYYFQHAFTDLGNKMQVRIPDWVQHPIRRGLEIYYRTMVALIYFGSDGNEAYVGRGR